MPEPTILETAVQTMLASIEGSNAAYPLFADQGAAAPFLIFQRVGADRDFTLQGPTGLTDVRMQIDAYAPGYLQARTLAGKVRQALDGFRGTVEDVEILACRLDNDFDIFEDETQPKLFRVSADYLISHREV